MNARIVISTLLFLLSLGSIKSTTILAEESSSNLAQSSLHIAVASNFHTTLKLLSKLYSEKHPTAFTISSASTGKLTTQIRFGAPYDIFLAADKKHPALLIEEQLAFDDSKYIYAQGQLVLISKIESGNSALNIIQSGQIKQLALANHKTAPYGFVANAWLEQSAIENPSFQRITSENVSQTWQHFQHGGVDAALVVLSQVLLSKNNPYPYWLLPEKYNQQLSQSAVILSSTKNKDAAELFISFLKSKAAKALISEAGYVIEN